MPDNPQPEAELPADEFDDPGAVEHPDQTVAPLPGSVS